MKSLGKPAKSGRAITRRRWGAQLAAGSAAALIPACAWPAWPAAAPESSAGSTGSTRCTQPLEMYIPWDETSPVNAGLRKVADDFGATHAQCTIQLSVVSPWNAEKLTAGLAAGSAPPLTLLPPAAVTTWGSRGLIDSVDELFKRDKLSGKDFFPPVWETMSYQGKVWHVPLQVDPNFPFFWNKSTLREAGLNPDKPPATVDELDRAAQTLNRESGGQWERVGFVPWGWYGVGNSVTTAAYMFGGSLYDKTRNTVTYSHPQVVKAVEWIAGWAQLLDMDLITQMLTGTTVVRQLAGGKVAFQPLVSVDISTARQENPGVQLGYGPLPAAAPGQPGAVWTGGWHAAAVLGSKRKDDAWEFLRWIGASTEGTLAVAKHMGGLPGYVRSPGLDVLAKDPDTTAHVDAIRRAKFLPPGFYIPVAIDYTPVTEAIAGQRPVKEALDEVTAQTQQKLDQFRAE